VSEQNFRDLVVATREGDVVAFIGAGLSAGRQPTWRELHRIMQEKAGLSPVRPFSEEDAPVDFEDFRDALGAEQYLALLREQFASPIADYPDLYRVIDETEGFRCLATTNFDEYLATVALKHARNPEIAEYPQFRPRYPRYIYLHGRAKTASSPSDLIVCEGDYALAYDDSGGANVTLKYLLTGPIVFLGCSLRDPDLAAVLKDVQRLRHTQGREFGPPPFAILAADPQEIGIEGLSLAEAVEVRTRRLIRRGVRPIWYESDKTHSQLRDLLLQLQYEVGRRPSEPLFLERAGEVDKLASVESPSQEQRERVLDLITDSPELARYFFQRATSVTWYDALLDTDTLSAVAEPLPDEEGRVRAMPWAAAPYVRRISSQRPDAVVELVLRLRKSENWHVRNVLSELAVTLPQDSLKAALPVLFEWLEYRYQSVSLVAHNLLEALERVAQRGSTALAAQILDNMLRPKRGSLGSSAQLVISDHELPRVALTIHRLIGDDPQSAYFLLKGCLLRAIDVASGRESSWWRAAIEDHPQNSERLEQPLQFLLTATRDALLTWIDQQADGALPELNQIVSSGEEILRRLGLHVLTTFPEQIAKLDVPPFTEDNFFDLGPFHELMVLLNQRFDHLPERQREVVHRLIREGPPPQDEGESSDDQQQRRDTWRWHLLAVISPEHQTAEEQAWREGLRATRNDPPEPFFVVFFHTGFIANEPQDGRLREARAQGMEALLSALRQESGRWDGLRELVREDPDGMLKLAPLMQREDFDHIWPYFDAYENLMKANVAVGWTPLVALVERMVPEPPENPGRAEWAAAGLLRSGMANRTVGIPADLLDRAFKVVVRIIDGLYSRLESGIEEDRDPAFHQLNTPSGQAADAFMLCVWRMAIQGGEDQPQIAPAARESIWRALHEGWGGLELRHAFGQFVRVLDWCEPGWLAASTDFLLPPGDSPNAVNAARSFLSGYLCDSQLVASLMRTLVPLYDRVIPDTGRHKPTYLSDEMMRRRFAEHLVIAWLWDTEGFDFDGLLGELLAVASDEVLAHVVWFLGAEHKKSTGELRTKLWQKMDEYWQRRVAELSSIPAAERSEELTRFCVWIEDANVPLADLEARLRLSIDHLTMGFAIDVLVTRFAHSGEIESAPSARLLYQIVSRWSDDPEVFWLGRDLEAAMDSICRGAGPEERETVRLIVDRLLETGRADFREKLRQF